jgi:hypothetical protein
MARTTGSLRFAIEVAGFVGGNGGYRPTEVYDIHCITTDSKENIYLGEVNNGRRAVRWNHRGRAVKLPDRGT